MRRGKRLIGVLAGVILAGVIGTAIPALAATVHWGPVTSSYGGIDRVTGYGDFYNSGTTVYSHMFIQDDASDGNNVYGKTEFYYWLNSSWNLKEVKSTPEWSGGLHNWTMTSNYSGYWTKAEGGFEACAQMGWPVPDSCTNWIYKVIDW